MITYLQSRCTGLPADRHQKSAAVIDQPEKLFQPVLISVSDLVEQRVRGKQEVLSQIQYLISGCPQVSFHTLQVFTEPLKPAEHGTERWIILRIQVIWKNYFVQDTGDHLCLIVFIGNKAVRKFIVISMAVLTAEPANHQLLLSAAFLFADTWSGISVVERSLTYGTNMGVLTALNKKHQNPP